MSNIDGNQNCVGPKNERPDLGELVSLDGKAALVQHDSGFDGRIARNWKVLVSEV